MTRLERLTDTPGDRGDWARDVIEQERWPEPPPGAESAVWRKLAAALPSGGPVSPSGPTGADGLMEAATGAGNPATSAAHGGGASVLAKLSAVGTAGKALVVSLVALGGGAVSWELVSGSHTTVASVPHGAPAVPTGRTGATVAAPDTPPPREEAAAVSKSPQDRRPVSAVERPHPGTAHAVAPPRVDTPPPFPPPHSSTLSQPHQALGRLPDVVTESTAPALPRAPSPSSSDLLEESTSLASIRAALRRGAIDEARRLLAQHRARHPGGRLQQEREVLEIEILWNSGSSSTAWERLEDYARHYPTSPHTPRLQRLMETGGQMPNVK